MIFPPTVRAEASPLHIPGQAPASLPSSAAPPPPLPCAAATSGSAPQSLFPVPNYSPRPHPDRDCLRRTTAPALLSPAVSGAADTALRLPPYADVSPTIPRPCAATSPLHPCRSSNASPHPTPAPARKDD